MFLQEIFKIEKYFDKIRKEERNKFQYFSMDLYDNYRLIAQKYLDVAETGATNLSGKGIGDIYNLCSSVDTTHK